MSDPYRKWSHEAPAPPQPHRHEARTAADTTPWRHHHIRLPPASSLLSAHTSNTEPLAPDPALVTASSPQLPSPGSRYGGHHRQQPPSPRGDASGGASGFDAPHPHTRPPHLPPSHQYSTSPYQQRFPNHRYPPHITTAPHALQASQPSVQPPPPSPVYEAYGARPPGSPPRRHSPPSCRQPNPSSSAPSKAVTHPSLQPPARQFNPPGGAEPPRTPSFSPSAAAAAAAAPQIRVSRIPNLLDGEKQAAIEGITFRLRMRQNPKAARACGSGERDRRNVDPPPIVQLHVEAPGLRAEEIDTYLRYEGYVMNCWIYDQTGTHDASNMPSEYRYQRRLTGSLVGTPFYGKDELGQEGCFFPFPDLSVRTLGKYRLKFTLIMLNVSRPGQARHFPILAETFSNVFEVYAVKDFPGICESSKLVRALRQQGCVISIKKGNDKKKKRDVPDPPDDDDGDGDGDDYDDNDDDGDGADGSRFGVKRQRSNATG